MKALISDIAMYHAYKAEHDRDGLLSERTCDDLDLEDFFLFTDKTSSCIGRQYLYNALHYNRASEITHRENLISTLMADGTLRTELQSGLGKLNHPDTYSIASLFATSHPVNSQSTFRLLRVLQVLPFLSLGLLYITSSAFFLWLLLAAVITNTVVHYRNKTRLQGYFFSVPQLLNLFKQADKLSKNALCLSLNKTMTNTLAELMPLRKRLADFRISIKLENDFMMIAYFLMELLNIFFLLEAVSLGRAFSLLQGKQQKIEDVFCFVGLIDTLCSVAQLRAELPYYTLPERTDTEERFRAEGLYHPLIKNCVANNIALRSKSVLITGSNMSGKTSFIRSVGINVLSAQALHTCFASRFCFPDGVQLSSAIHLEDSLMEGKSFFLQEVQTIKEMLDKAVSGNQLFLLDELFKGTNTAERIAIANAVLSALAKQRNMVFVSTHDIELASLLKDEYDLYHFCERVTEEKLTFDYKLKSGPVTERNAIRILGICDYPQAVIQDAYDTLGRMA